MSPFWILHRTIMAVIRHLPLPLGRFGFRAYHKLMRTWRPTYIGRSFFGARFVCSLQDLIQRTIFYFGVWEPDVSHVIEQRLAPGDVFVDIGANIGYDTLLASHRVGRTGRVVSIEASGRTFGLLQRNLSLNDAANVRAVHVAIADRPGKLELYETDSGNIGAATTLSSRGGRLLESVEALPLLSVLSPAELARIRLIKMDVEGAELAILRQILAELPRFPPGMDIVVEASPHDDPAWNAVFAEMQSHGFTAYEIANRYETDWYLRWRCPTPLVPVDILPSRLQDLLFTRQPLR